MRAGATALSLPLRPPYPPMEAQTTDELPAGGDWVYEPKWDGFRCLAFVAGRDVELQSKSGRPLGRYFPDVAAALAAELPAPCVLDGELVIPFEGALSFEALQLRLHPAASRVRMLAEAHPAVFVAFDLLALGARDLTTAALAERRRALEAFARRWPRAATTTLRLSPTTTDRARARRWLASRHGGLDGVIAKRRDLPYRSGTRDGMVKVKPIRTLDCVVGGFRWASRGKVVGSLLLGLYDDESLLHHVGFTSSFAASDRAALTRKLAALVRPPGFTGAAPGAPSRWSTERSSAWEPLAPKLVVEVQYDHASGGRLRHGARFLRWRPDKAPRQCTFDQLPAPGRSSFALLREEQPRR